MSGSNTSQLSTQAAATITPTTSSQTAVASGKYTTGAVTVAAIPSQYKDTTGTDATAAYIASGYKAVTGSGLITGTAAMTYNALTEELSIPGWAVTLA